MLPTKTIKKLEESNEFKEWRTKNKDDYLSHIVTMGDDRGIMEIAIGYYDTKSDRITTFVMGKNIIVKPKTEVFKKGGEVERLDVSKAKLSLEKITKEAEKAVEEHYKGADVGRVITILQNLDGSEVWNISVVTSNFGVVNVRIDPTTGKVISHQKVSLFDQ